LYRSEFWATTPEEESERALQHLEHVIQFEGPNTVGAIALAAAIRQLEKVGMSKVAHHEALLTSYALEGLNSIKGVKVFGDHNPANAEARLGVIPIMLEQVPHFLAAAVLGHEFGIGVRSGCFCAHPYILNLLGLSKEEAAEVRRRMMAGDKSDMPGLIRASFGLYNTLEDVDALLNALTSIAMGNYKGKYVQDRATGEYTPIDWQPDFAPYFAI
jgi:selenocysteine lyase/cysteine desulfurase